MIQAINLAETVQLDKDRVAEIISRLGPRGTDEMISHTMEELAVQLAKVHRAVELVLAEEIKLSAIIIAEFSLHIGLPSLNRAALNVVDVVDSGCVDALAATTARLNRVGEASLMQDLSM